MRIRLARGLSEGEKTAVANHLQNLPHQNSICHGDFHLDNIILTEAGSVIIDWCNACCGHPLADVARSAIMLTMGAMPDNLTNAEQEKLQKLRQQFHDIYLGHYLEQQPMTHEQLRAWLLPVAAARLAEDIPEETADLLAFVRRSLSS